MNPLNHFISQMIEFQIYRNSVLIDTVKGLKNTEKGSNKKFIGFFPDVDIQIGDFLMVPNTSIKSVSYTHLTLPTT